MTDKASTCTSCRNRMLLLEEVTKDVLAWKTLAMEYATSISELSDKATKKQVEEHFFMVRKKTRLAKKGNEEEENKVMLELTKL